jgi:hypothetical protein
MSTLNLPAKTETIEIQCDCAVCEGLRAEVPVGLFKGSKEGTKSYRTRVHNLVCLAWSPLGVGANCVRIAA